MAAQKKFNIGDIVERINCNNLYSDGRILEVGTICTVVGYEAYGFLVVEANDIRYEGCSPDCFKPVLSREIKNLEKIIIIHNGKTTTATQYNGLKKVATATSKCHPEDEFDFNVGAKIALDRLIEKTTKLNYYNGKIVCVARGYENKNYLTPIDTFTIGKVYNVVNGVIADDNGYKLTGLKNLHEICVGLGNTFIPIVE